MSACGVLPGENVVMSRVSFLRGVAGLFSLLFAPSFLRDLERFGLLEKVKSISEDERLAGVLLGRFESGPVQLATVIDSGVLAITLFNGNVLLLGRKLSNEPKDFAGLNPAG